MPCHVLLMPQLHSATVVMTQSACTRPCIAMQLTKPQLLRPAGPLSYLICLIRALFELRSEVRSAGVHSKVISRGSCGAHSLGGCCNLGSSVALCRVVSCLDCSALPVRMALKWSCHLATLADPYGAMLHLLGPAQAARALPAWRLCSPPRCCPASAPIPYARPQNPPSPCTSFPPGARPGGAARPRPAPPLLPAAAGGPQ